ncbi:MAG: tyrosine-type recombinase/integrase [Woeseia sp.]|jgi:integrase|nr:tyrosine-type recombinase/integrase [Woeseia sp.]
MSIYHVIEELLEMAKIKRKKGKRIPWNKGRIVGQRAPLSLSEVTRVKKMLAKRGYSGLRDRALFLTAIDTRLSSKELLELTVKVVRKRTREMRDTFSMTTTRNGQKVRCELSKTTMGALEKWINQSAKKPNNYLFTGRVGGGMTPLSVRQFSRLVKTWTADIGLDASAYGTESLRKTGALKR